MDYDALAKQFGGVLAAPEGEGMPSNRQPAAVDYDALAKQFGGVPAASEGRSRGGFRKQVEEAFTNPAETPRIPTAAELAGRYGAMGRGAAEGVIPSIVGLPGDVVGIFADNPYTSHEIGNAMFGEATSADQARGRLFGAAGTSLLSPLAAARIIGPGKEMVDAARLARAARTASATPPINPYSLAGVADVATGAAQAGASSTLGAAQIVLDPITAALQGGGALWQKSAEGIKNQLSPTRRMLEPALEGNAEGVVNMLRNPNAALVAGTQPTVGEIVAGAGTSQTQLPALQFKLTSNPALASEFAAREAANARAQAASIGTIAPEIPADITAARQARAGQAAVDYGKVEKQIVPYDETLAALLETPAMKSAVSVAEDIAANKGRTFKIGENVPAHEVPSSIVDPATGKPVMRQIPAQNAEYTGQSLLDIKAGLDKALETKVDAAGSALGNKQLAAISDVRQQYVNWLEDKLPGVKTARTEFAARSKPINAMEVGQVLKESLTSPLDETLRPAAFAQAVRNAPGTIKKATGAPRFEDLSAILDTADSAKVANVLSDLSRTAEYRRLAKAGGRPNAMGSVTDIPGAQGFIGQAATAIMKALEGVVSRKASIEIGAAMLHPETFARLVEKYAIPNAPRNIMERNARMLATQERNVRRNNLLRGGVQTSNALAPQEAP